MPFLTDVAKNLRHVRFPKNAPAKVFRPQPQNFHPHYPTMTRDYYGPPQTHAHPTQAPAEQPNAWDKLLGRHKKKQQNPQPYGAPVDWGLPPERFHATQAQAPAKQPSKWDKLLGKHKKKKQNPEPQVQVPNVRVRRGDSTRRAHTPITRPTGYIGPDGRVVQRPTRENTTVRRQRQIADDEALAYQVLEQEQRELRQAATQVPRRRPVPTTANNVNTTANNVNRRTTRAEREAARRAQDRYAQQGLQLPTVPDYRAGEATVARRHPQRPDAHVNARIQHQPRQPVNPPATTLNRTGTTRAAAGAPRTQQPAAVVPPPPHMRPAGGLQPNIPTRVNTTATVARRLTQKKLPYNRTVGAQLGLHPGQGKMFNEMYDILLGKVAGKNPEEYAITINSEQNVDFHLPTPESCPNFPYPRNPDGTLRKRFLNDGVQITLLDDYLLPEQVVTIPRSKLPRQLLVNTGKDMDHARAYHERNLRNYLRLGPYDPLPHNQTNLPNWIGDPAATPEHAKEELVKWLKTLERPVAPRVDQDGRIQRTTTLTRGNSTARRRQQMEADEAMAKRLQQELEDEEFAQQLNAQDQHEIGQAAMRQAAARQTHQIQRPVTPPAANNLNRRTTRAEREAARRAQDRYAQQGLQPATVPGVQAGAHHTQQPAAARPVGGLQQNAPNRTGTLAARAAARRARERYEQQGMQPAPMPDFLAGTRRVQQPVARPPIHLPDRIDQTNLHADIMNSHTVSQLAHDPKLLDKYNDLLLMQNHMLRESGHPQAAFFQGPNPFAGLNQRVAADGTMTDEARALFKANRSSYHRLAKKHGDLANRHYDEWLSANPQYQHLDDDTKQTLAHHAIGRHLDISQIAGNIASEQEKSLHGLSWLRHDKFDINCLSGGKQKTQTMLDTLRHSIKQTPVVKDNGTLGEVPDLLESVFINERGPQTEITFMDEYSMPLGGDTPINIPTGQIPLTVLRNPKKLLGQWLGVGKFPDGIKIEKGAGLNTYD